jgi:serine protease inhibitor
LQLGVNTIFSQSAELRKVIVPDEELYVSDAIQKATITVDENGAEAAAANGNDNIEIVHTHYEVDDVITLCVTVY